MNNKRSYIFFLLSFLLFVTFSGKFNFVQAADYDNKGTKLDVDANKSWIVRFNKELDGSTIDESKFVVTDANGQQIAVSAKLGDDKKSVVVSPKSQYSYGKTYSLIVKDGIKAANKSSLIKSSKIEFTVKTNTINEANKAYTVCIDAGHGGSDAGNVGQTGIKEKDIDLSVALKAGKILKDNGVNVIYTRESDDISWDKNNDLQARFDIANKAKADLFLTIHVNGYPDNPSSNGIETYYSSYDSAGKSVAEQIQDQLASITGLTNRGAKEGRPQHEILRGASGTSIMVQLGFMTNPKESLVIGGEEFQNKSANAIANGVLKSLSLVKQNKDATITSIQDISANISIGGEYALPTNVQATMSNGSTKTVGVVWDSNSVDSSKEGTYTYKGTVAGYNKQVILTLLVAAKSTEPPSGSGTTIVIDPGHGIGRDSGSTGLNGLQEDDVTLSVGLKVGKILEEKGVNVVYTRTTDERTTTPISVTESLQRRCDTANNANAKYLVSIHTNAFDYESARGTETLYYTGNSEGERLASAIQKHLVSELGTYNRGLKDGSWLYIAKNTTAPTVLAELGFLTNPDDAAVLGNEEGQNKAAKAVADGILEVLGM